MVSDPTPGVVPKPRSWDDRKRAWLNALSYGSVAVVAAMLLGDRVVGGVWDGPWGGAVTLATTVVFLLTFLALSTGAGLRSKLLRFGVVVPVAAIIIIFDLYDIIKSICNIE